MPTKILIVDDEIDSLKLIGLMLQRQGYDVAMAQNGQQALEGAISEDPDLIILDVMMPDMDGYEVCRRLREDERTEGIPIIMFTAKSMVDDKVTGFEAGADDYLTKPTHPAELAARVQAVLTRSAAKQAGDQQPYFTYGFIGAKGGVGLSTLAMNVGAVMAQQEATTLVDFRLGQGTIGLSLGFPKQTGLADVLKNPKNINSKGIEDQLVTHHSGLRLLSASPRSRESQLKLSPEAARAIIKALGTHARHVLIDMGPGLNALTMSLVRELTQLAIVVEPHQPALALGRDILNELRQANVPATNINLVIVNRAPSSLQVAWQDAEQFLEHDIKAVIPAVPELAFQAVENNMPLASQHPDAVVSGQYSKLAAELVKQARSALQ